MFAGDTFLKQCGGGVTNFGKHIIWPVAKFLVPDW
jgi:hypothetical protein